MFCFQCEETVKGTGCVKSGTCGKTENVSNLDDLLIYLLKGAAYRIVHSKNASEPDNDSIFLLIRALFSTITNVNFDADSIKFLIDEVLDLRNKFIVRELNPGKNAIPDCAIWEPSERTLEKYLEKAAGVGIKNPDDDTSSLEELLMYGLKGMAAYAYHAYKLGQVSAEVNRFIPRALNALAIDGTMADREDLLDLVFECGEKGVTVMKLLDGANTSRFGKPEPTTVINGTRKGKAILISGHDLLELEELLKQTENTEVQVYTHCEMLPAHAYPRLKKYKHLAGNYGGAWWEQRKEFENFNGPIVMTTNCIQKPSEAYRNRIFTTDLVEMPGVKHVDNHDFSEVIDIALSMEGNNENIGRPVITGFAHDTLEGSADNIIEMIKENKIKKFVVMAGCDGRENERSYYTNLAGRLSDETVILTAGCAKYRFNRLDLTDVAGLPKVIDAGQCNDSYSLAIIALTLKEKLGLEDINDLPVYYEIAWYEQKAVLVLLSLLYLGVKNIRLGINLPAFLSKNVKTLLMEKFNIMGVCSTEESLEYIN